MNCTTYCLSTLCNAIVPLCDDLKADILYFVANEYLYGYKFVGSFAELGEFIIRRFFIPFWAFYFHGLVCTGGLLEHDFILPVRYLLGKL